MNFAVKVTFEADVSQYDCAPLASFRGATVGAGWVLRIDAGILSAISSPPEYMPVRVRLPWDSGAHVIEWRVVGDRHELWLDGVPSAEAMGGLILGDADTLREGEDPEMPGKTYAGVLSVEVSNG
jgi:hypothetical protein